MITVSVQGPDRVSLVKNLRAFADNLDGAPAPAKGKGRAEPNIDTQKEDFDEEPEAVVVSGKKAQAVADDFDDDFEEAPLKKPTKGKKGPTKEDVFAACKAHASRHTFEETKALLQKKFKTASVNKLSENQYASVLEALED